MRVCGADLRHFNPAILGQSANENVKLLIDDFGDIYPSAVQVDVTDGKFSAATVEYSSEISLEEARGSLNKLYRQWLKADFANDPTMGLWRNEEKRFAIQLTREKNAIVVRYVSFLGKKATSSRPSK